MDEKLSFTATLWNSADSKKKWYEKDLIYGNGYQINLKAINDGISTELTKETGGKNDGMFQTGMENTGYGFRMGTIYNLTLKGTTAETEITPKTNRILFNLGGAFYSTVQNYSKLNPSGANFYLKNSVMRFVANAAIQLWSTSKNIYFENVVIAECLRALSLEKQAHAQLYFKGFTDVLNYTSAMGMQNSFKLINGGGTYAGYFLEKGQGFPGLTDCNAKEYLEWFGKNGTVGTENYRYYANLLVTSVQESTKQCHYWDDTASKYSDNQTSNTVGINFADAFIGIDYQVFKMGVDFSTYAVKASVDGGNETFDDRDTNLLFTNARDIRLLCEYVDINDKVLIKNTEHILWHMQKVHRNVNLIENRKTDHIDALKESLENAKGKSGWDGVWPDGSTLDEALNAVSQSAAALNKMLSQTVLPTKRSY